MTKELALEILNETIIYNGYFYLIVLLISTVSSYLVSLLKGSGKEKGKYLAIESSLNTIEKQVALTTKTSESIKTIIEHDSWRKKELEVLKREKLEEYFLHISSLNNALNSEMIDKLFGSKTDYDPHCFDKANMIQSLYLPELLVEHYEVTKAVRNFTSWVADGLFLIAEQLSKGVQNPKPTREFMQKHPALLKALIEPISNALQKSKKVAQAINT
jgi:tRNA/tmRNA/rRNA uracil-C5-methylase (TrmA/RlmC/RlmD family)